MSEQVNVTINSDNQISCEECIEFISNHIRRSQGVLTVEQTKKQLKLSLKLRHHEIRRNTHFSSPIHMETHLCLSKLNKGARELISSCPGITNVSISDKRDVAISGKININDLVQKLERDLGVDVSIKSIIIYGDDDVGSSSCVNPLHGVGL